jgi:subfamily B ATP-binding cassette protein MsbA
MASRGLSDIGFAARFVRPHLRTLVVAVACMALYAFTTSIYAYLAGPALKVILTSISAGAESMTLTILDRLSAGIGLEPVLTLGALTLLRSAVNMAETVLMGRAGQSIQQDVRDAMFEKLLTLPPLAMLKVKKGDLISKLVADVTMMEIAVTHALASLIREGLQILFLAALAFYLNAPLTLLALVVLPPGILAVFYLSRRIRLAFRNALNQRGRIASLFMEAARGLPVIKIFTAEKEQMERLRSANRDVFRAMMKAIWLTSSVAPVMEMLGAVALGGLLLYVLFAAKEHLGRPEAFISFFAALFLLYRPIKSLGSIMSFLQQGLAATRRIRDMLEGDEDLPGGTQETPPLEGEVRLDGVRFAYDDRSILEGVSLSLPAGRITAIVGASGEGKTTLIHLLCGFLRPRAGRLLWDGRDYADLSTSTLRGRISLVTQDPFLLNATIEENILLGRNREKKRDLMRAVSAAGLDGLVGRLREGLSTNVEEEASSLSAGERQRICIARAVLSGTDLVVFDEAASSLDSRSEDTIHASLREIGGSKTILVVSHRLSTIKVADRIAVLEGGRIVEEGIYADLARPGTAFYALFSSQILKDGG